MATPQPVDARTQPWRETPGGDLVALGRPVRQALHLVRHNPAQGRVLSRRETILLVLFALTLHGAVIHWLSQQRTPALPEVPPQVPPMTIEFTAPAPPVVEPPPPEPLPPVVEEPPPPVVDENAVKPPPPKPVPKPKPKPKPQPRPKPAPKAVEPAPPAPPQPAAPPAPPAPAALPAQPGAGIPRPGHAPRLGGHRAVAGACPRQRQPERDPGAEVERTRSPRPGRGESGQALVLRSRQARRQGRGRLGQRTDRFQVELNLQRHEEHPS